MLSNCRVRGGAGWLGAALLGIGLTCVAGCGGGPPYKTAPVSGKVVYEDGTPIKGAIIRLDFFPQVEAIDPKTPPRSGQAEVKADGTFDAASTWKAEDGLILGKHKVCIQVFDEKNNVLRVVPPIYQDPNKTPLEVTVTSSGMEPAELKIKKK